MTPPPPSPMKFLALIKLIEVLLRTSYMAAAVFFLHAAVPSAPSAAIVVLAVGISSVFMETTER
jgi:hypothetical protein